jgi:hypothetical protein
MLWVHVFLMSLSAIGYCLMHYNMYLPCVWKVREKLQTHLPKLIWLIITFGIAFKLFLFAINIKNEVYGVLESFFLFQRI